MKYQFNKKEHIHTLDGKPLMGTSTVVGVIGKPLTYWASGLAVAHLGWTNPKITPEIEQNATLEARFTQIKGMTTEEYKVTLHEAYHAHTKKLKSSASDGTDMHAELEKYVIACIETNNGSPIVVSEEVTQAVKDFATWSLEEVDKFLWSEMHCYSEELWLGGVSDAGAKLKNGKIGIIDFKSSKDSYQSQFIQCALYDIEISENGGFTEKGEKIMEKPESINFYAVVPFGAKKFKIDFRYNTEELKEAGRACVTLYKINNNI